MTWDGNSALADRRQLSRVILFYKIHHNLVLIPIPDYLTLNPRPNRNRHHLCYNIPSVNKDCLKWAQTWQMQFNTSKCKVMHVGHRNERAIYNMDNHRLEEVEEEKDLGVLIHRTLSVSNNCAVAVKKANQMAGHIYRTVTHKSIQTVVPLYKALYGVPFSHLFTVNCRYLQLKCTYLQFNCRYLQFNCRYLQFNWRYLQIG